MSSRNSKTEVYFSFDTEDFTHEKAWDAQRREAELLERYGIRGNFNIVGYVAREWLSHGRYDVPAAISRHDVSFHSLRHSYHPTINEYTDVESYGAARDELLRQECQGMGMVKAATGVRSFVAACPPGNSLSYVAMYEYAKLGIPLYVGSVFEFADGSSVYMCNALHTNYDFMLEHRFLPGAYREAENYDLNEFLDAAARKKRVVFYTHPTRAYYRKFWDLVSYRGENTYEFGKWGPTPENTPEQTAEFFRRFEEFICAIRSDGRFEIKEMRGLAEKAKLETSRRVVRYADLPYIRDALHERLWAVRLPSGTLSLTDCFAAAAHFCRSRDDYIPGPVRGFLSSPRGITKPLTLDRDEVIALAGYEPDSFLPPSFMTSRGEIGPADMLFAMLDAATGAPAVVLEPREQMPELSGGYASLCDLHMSGDSWVHSPDFRDAYISDRLRLQSWTIREE